MKQFTIIMTKLKCAFLLILIFNAFANVERAYATHAAGTDITYKCLGGLQYEITVTFYRDCEGIDEPVTAPVRVRSVLANYDQTFNAPKIAGTGQEITVPCVTANTTCNGGSVTGIRQFVYRTTITLPSARTDWTFSFAECCRNCSITTILDPCGTNNELYVEAKLNNVTAPCNSSPTFSNIPIAFVCIGQNFNYNHGVLDVDGDSLAYSLIAPKISASSNVTFIAPATATTPLSSSSPFTIDDIIGDINFTPNQIQIGVMAVFVREYRQGQLIGSTIRDMQVYTQVCSNALPTASGIDGTTNFSVTVCPDQQLCFDIFSDDINAGQIVTLTTNEGISGASYIVSGTPHPSLHFCWTPTFADVNLLPHTFTVTVQDDACPTNGVQTFSYSVFVPSPFFTVATTNVSCNGGSDGSATASPVFGDVYTYVWNTVPPQNGPAIANLLPGAYTVVATDINQCSVSATVDITEPDLLNLSFQSTPNNCSAICNGEIDLTVTGGTLPYGYSWSNGATIQDLTGICADTYTVVVTDFNNCTSTGSETLTENPVTTCSISGVKKVCDGNCVTWTASGGVSYLWSTGATVASISVCDANTYTVTVTGANGCSSSCSETLYVDPLPSCDISGHLIICDGETTQLCASGGISYLWNTNETTACITVSAGETYVVTVTDANGCSSSCSETVIQSPPIDVKCDVDNYTGYISVLASGGTPPLSYLWSNGQTASSFYTNIDGTYTVTVTDGNECTAKCSVTFEFPCKGRTQTQGGWGATPQGNNPAKYLQNNFAAVFTAPDYLTIGCNRKLRLTSSTAVKDFLPSGSTPAQLPLGTLVNPGGSYSNVLAGQLVALTLNIRFDLYDPNFSPASENLKDYIIASGVLAGLTVQQLWQEAMNKIGGCGSIYTLSQLNNAINKVNNNFNGSSTNKMFLYCPDKKREESELMDPVASDIISNAYPNPFALTTTIEFELTGDKAENAVVEIYEMSGRKMATLMNEVIQPNTQMNILVDGSKWEKGVYMYLIKCGNKTVNGKLFLMD